MNIIEQEQKIMNLKRLLNHYDDMYYNHDTSEVSDYVYDALKKEYLKLSGKEEYEYVPGKASKDSTKFAHTTNVSSLSKLQISEVDKIRENLERLWPVVIQPKMDGLTVVTYSFTNEAVHVTRGNGLIGEVVSENMQNVIGVGNITMNYPVRQEVVMLKSEFNRINAERVENGEEPFKNTRNAAAGMLRQKDSSKVQGLKTFAYNTINPQHNGTAQAQIKFLQDFCWNTVDSYEPTSIDDAIEYIKSYDRSILDYDIDGLVIKHNGDKEFGETGHHPKNAIAIKFEAEGAWTTLKDIRWQVGRTGKLTPVAEFEPVDILGSTVSRATLHNYAIMEGLNLTFIMYKGKYTPISQVKVIKANDVIPAIIEVKHETDDYHNMYTKQFHKPTECPECKGEVTEINDQIYCTNPFCGAKLLNALTHLAQRDAFNIEGLSEETAKKLIAKRKELCPGGHRIHPSFIFSLTYNDILSLEGFAEVSARKLHTNIQKAMTQPLDRFLYGCGVPLIGKRASKSIAQFFGNTTYLTEDIVSNDCKDMKTIKDVGNKLAESIKENWEDVIIPYGYYMTIEPVEKVTKAENQLTFVITGTLEHPRKYYEDIITNAGHKVSGSVSKKTSYVLAGEEAGSKLEKAMTLGINILRNEEELNNVL